MGRRYATSYKNPIRVYYYISAVRENEKTEWLFIYEMVTSVAEQ